MKMVFEKHGYDNLFQLKKVQDINNYENNTEMLN